MKVIYNDDRPECDKCACDATGRWIIHIITPLIGRIETLNLCDDCEDRARETATRMVSAFPPPDEDA